MPEEQLVSKRRLNSLPCCREYPQAQLPWQLAGGDGSCDCTDSHGSWKLLHSHYMLTATVFALIKPVLPPQRRAPRQRLLSIRQALQPAQQDQLSAKPSHLQHSVLSAASRGLGHGSLLFKTSTASRAPVGASITHIGVSLQGKANHRIYSHVQHFIGLSSSSANERTGVHSASPLAHQLPAPLPRSARTTPEVSGRSKSVH